MDEITVRRAVTRRLLEEPAVVGALSPYDGHPGVFDDAAPPGALTPYAVVGLVGGDRDDTIDRQGRELAFDVAVYDDEHAGRPRGLVREVAEAAAALFHRSTTLELERGACVGCLAGVPGPGPAEPGVRSRLFTLRVMAQE